MTDNFSEIVLISDPRVLKIPIQDNGEPLIDLSEYDGILIGESKDSQYPSSYKVRKSVADKLLHASVHLPHNIRLLIREGYRPLNLQKLYFEDYRNILKTDHPEWSLEQLNIETTKFVAPPDTVPPHSTGGAFDLTLADADGKELDMGSIVNATPEQYGNISYTNLPDISQEAKENRKMLINALKKEGFVNYPTEWWHWSYGDRYWAYQTKNDFALFGSV